MTQVRSKLLAGAALGAALLTSSFAVGCGGSGKPPTLPTPIATPTPTPTPDPNVPPADSSCKPPIPPDISRIGVKISYKYKEYWIIDSSPLVGPDPVFCLHIGYTDGRKWCTLRQEGDPTRPDCENWRAGIAEDTHDWGPTWKFTPPGGTWTYCTGPASGCEHYPGSPYQLKAYLGGHYQLCTAKGVCAEIDVDRNL